MPTARPFDRRVFLRGTAVAAGALAAGSLVSFRELAQAATFEAQQSVFGYGVASGDPTATAVILWTRVNQTPDSVPGTPAGQPVPVTWEVAADEGFAEVLRTGTVTTGPERDYTVKVDVTGLTAYTRYFYRFRALDTVSAVGRTQTAPDEPGVTHALRFAFASCANYTGGYFSSYQDMARRDDLDFVLFLGDYVYEYGNGADRYGPVELKGERDHQPGYEMIALADYRLRHALYKTDPGLQACHKRHPWIPIFDDHEVTNNTYASGAENHEPGGDPDTDYGMAEGDFFVRRRAAYQAYLEWLPIRLPDQTGAVGEYRFWRRFTFGDLADLSVLETRQNRSEQVSNTDVTALAAQDRHLPEPQQLEWLRGNLAATAQQWHLVGNQVVLAPVRIPALPTGFTPPAGFPAQPQGAVFNPDQWDGYQADQSAVLAAMGAATRDPVVFTGDIHSSWANDLPVAGYTDVTRAGFSVGTEFVCPSITSDGFYEIFGRNESAATVATNAFQQQNRHVRMLDGIRHGYGVADVTPQRVQVDYLWLYSERFPDDPRLDPDGTVRVGTSWRTDSGSRIVLPAAAPLGDRSDAPRSAAQPSAVVPEFRAAGLAPMTAAALFAGLIALRRRGERRERF